MLVNLSKIFTAEEREKNISLQLDFSGEEVAVGADFNQPVNARVYIRKEFNGEIFIRLGVQAMAVCSCARCLKQFDKKFDLTQEFLLPPAFLTDSEIEIPVDADNNLDLRQLVLQELSLAVPCVLLCREDCPGLCPVCGRPKEENCGCQLEERIDPRLSILKQLLDDDNN